MTAPVASSDALDPVIVLVETQLADNIGAAARAMLNFGLTRLRLANPKPEWPNDRAKAVSSGADKVLDQAQIHRSLSDAIADRQVVYATTARPREIVKRIVTPAQAALELRAHAAAGVKTALLFGPERTGLVNDDVVLCDAVIAIPTSPEHSSLNLAQAVLLTAYEWFKAADQTPASEIRTHGSPIAPKQAQEALMKRLEHELDVCGFLRLPHMRPAMVRNLRAVFARAQPTDQELRTLHGVITELVTRRVGCA